MQPQCPFCHRLAIITASVLACLRLVAATDTVVLLYTADIHDHLRAGKSGIGGVAYVSGYIKQVRSQRPDVVVVDAGDVVNKGDMLPFLTQGETMYRAMGKIGYNAVVPGNHDFTYGLPHLLSNAEAAGFPMLCANIQKNDGSEIPLQKSTVINADGVNVGIIGFTLVGAQYAKAKCRALDMKGTAASLQTEVKRLADKTHIIIAVGHFPTQKCVELSALVPEIDIFVAGHSHQILPEGTQVPATGALVVQSGSNAQNVGHLEVTVDLDTGTVVERHNQVVKLSHATVPEDREMTHWIAAMEKTVCPEAGETLGKVEVALPRSKLARLYARAIREKSSADIALVNEKRLLGGFSAGQTLDTNAVFATYRMALPEVTVLAVSGADLIRAMGTFKTRKTAPAWDGFTGKLDPAKPDGERLSDSDLDPERVYSVAINDAASNAASLQRTFGLKAPDDAPRRCQFSPVDALVTYIREATTDGKTLHPL